MIFVIAVACALALAFERAAEVDEAAARAWTRRSRWRMPLDLLTCAAMLGALIEASQP